MLWARVCGCGGPTLFPWPARPLGAACRGYVTRVSWVRTGPKPCEPLMRAVGAAVGRSRGSAFHRCEGRLSSGASPPLAARPLGGLSGSAAHVLWVRACGCGSSALSPRLACPAGAACLGVGRGPSPGGLAFHPCEGCLVSGAVSPPTVRPLGRVAGVPQPLRPGCGLCGRGHRAQRAGVARCGAGGRASPGGMPFAVVRGV